MPNWTTKPQPFGANHAPLLEGLSSVDGITPVPVAVDPATGGIITSLTSGGAVTIANGADTAEGATTDAAVTAGSTGTISGKLRQISSDISTSNTLMATSANQTNGTQQTKTTDGTNIVNVLKSDGTAAGQNAELVAGTYLPVPFTTATAQAVGSTDAGNYSWVAVHVVTQGGSSTVTFQTSNDNTNWVNQVFYPISSTNGQGIATSTTGAGVVYSGPLAGRYFRLNVTGIVSGNTAGVIVFSSNPRGMNNSAVQATQLGTWTVGSNSATGSAVPANAFYMAVNAAGGLLTGVGAPTIDAGGVTSGLGALGESFNGTNWDRNRNNVTGVIIAAGATSTNAGVSTTTYNASKAIIIINISAFTSGSLTVTVNGITSSGYSYPILVSTALAATGVTPLRIFPGSSPSGNAVANDMVPRTIQVVTAVTGTLTYGIDYELSV